MLPDISLNSNTQDVGKQISSLRTQLASLKDAVESDLNNIGYENLSASLKSKIDNMSTLVESTSQLAEVVAQTMKVKYASIEVLDAEMARVGTLEANMVNINGSLSAMVADIQTIQANYVTTAYLQSNYATIGALNSITISASQITSGTISASRIDVANLLANTTASHMARINYAALAYLYDAQGRGGFVKWQKINSSSNQYFLMIEDNGGNA